MTPRRYGPLPYVPITRRPKLTWPDGARGQASLLSRTFELDCSAMPVEQKISIDNR
jgi:hypothetical protein